MSREKECKCCHEWWYASVIKEDLCPNCYDYFKQLKQQLAEKDKEIANLQVLIIENKNDIKEMREFKIGDNEYDLTDEDARNDIKNQLENQTQLAIQELEKVKDWLNEPFDEDGCFKNGGDLIGFVDQQIKKLKGEKDAED